MRILITNDDGINAEGLKVLEKIARKLSDDIWIIAPERNQSGAGHSLTLSDPIRARKIDEKKFAVTGTPTDCVVFACRHLMLGKNPDLVLSGINHGDNLAENVTYSGTVAAAMEASLFSIPSIAMSLVIDNESENHHWDVAEHYAPDIIKKIISCKIPENVFMNVNFPKLNIDEVLGAKITRQGKHEISGDLIERKDPRNQSYFWVGPLKTPQNVTPDTDLGAITDGYISITPLRTDLTDMATTIYLKEAFD